MDPRHHVREDGSSGAIEFLVDLINTTENQTYTIDLQAEVELPDGTVVDLPMGGLGNVQATFTIDPGDFAFTSIIDPVGMRFSFPLDQAPFPQPIPEGAYKMEVRCFSGPALIYLDEDIDFWVTDRTGAPFREVTAQSGLDQVNLQGGSKPEVGNSMAVFDYDHDGLTDLFATNPSGANTFLPIGPDTPFPGGRNYLMRNNGDGTFTDVTAAAGVVGNTSKGSYGATWGDFNRDGYNDLVVANRNLRPYVYKNNGDGTFADVGASFIGGDASSWDFAPRAADIDLDGDLDVFVGTYLDQFDTTWQLTGYRSELYLNGLAEGNLFGPDPTWPQFLEVAQTAGVAKSGTTLAAFFADYDRDGAIDLAVHNDFGAFTEPNELYRGSNDGTFAETSGPSQYNSREFSMGGTATDFNGDGWLDSYSSSIGRNSLLLNDGTGNFIPSTAGSGAEGDFMAAGPQADGVFLDDNWGVMSWDYDLDGDWDLYVAGSDLFTTYNMPIAELHPDSVFENDGTGHFTRAEAALGLDNTGRTRSSVQIDYDNDGDMDVVTSAENEGVTLMRNDLDTGNSWLRVRPVTHHAAPGGFNTLFRITTADKTQVHELGAESSHSSHVD
ncbi:MAG: VCBS repeat-containing protein, partial [Planctomycetota bacterium]